MKKIGLFYGSSSDNTKTAAEFIAEYLEMNDVEVESFDIADCDLEKIMEFDNIINVCLNKIMMVINVITILITDINY